MKGLDTPSECVLLGRGEGENEKVKVAATPV